MGRDHDNLYALLVIVALAGCRGDGGADQCSTGATLSTIGFKSAVRITFPQSIGVTMGSSLGTTCT